jgi:hypothetical protein
VTSSHKAHSTKRHHFEVPPSAQDNQVLTLREWSALNHISPRTAHRILKGPNRPVVTMLSSKRIGITIGNNRRWQKSRERA